MLREAASPRAFAAPPFARSLAHSHGLPLVCRFSAPPQLSLEDMEAVQGRVSKRGFCFMNFESHEAACAAMEKLQDEHIGRDKLVVGWSMSKA